MSKFKNRITLSDQAFPPSPPKQRVLTSNHVSKAAITLICNVIQYKFRILIFHKKCRDYLKIMETKVSVETSWLYQKSNLNFLICEYSISIKALERIREMLVSHLHF